MKKSLLAGLFCAMSLGAYAQGTISFVDRVSGTEQYFHIYAPQASGLEVQGASSLDTPAGSTVYDAGSLLGGSSAAYSSSYSFAAGSPVYGYGNLFDVQLYAAPGTGDSFSSLSPVSQYFATMRTTTSSGAWGTFITPSITGDPGIPGTPEPALGGAVSATVALVAWYNAGGTLTTLAEAQSAGVPWGESPTLNIASLGEGSAVPPVTAPTLSGLESFSLVASTSPEPSTIALGLMGVCGFLARRRKV
jgi:hypothetical protein